MRESNLDITLIEQIAEELAIDPSFIEKDWYATQALRVIHAADSKECRFIFAGGTCLSKAYGLIERFSEDIDFKIAGELLTDRNVRRCDFSRRIYSLLYAAFRGKKFFRIC